MISWIVNNISYSLDDRTNFYMMNHEGLLSIPLHRLSERGPLQHGVTDRGYRLDPRTVILSMGINGTDSSDFYTKRSTLASIFKPSNTAGYLRYVNGTTTRQLDCHCIAIQEGERSNYWQNIAIALLCPDPTWYDPTVNEVYFALGGGEDTLEVPMEVPMLVGSTSLVSNQSITYNGDFRAFPVIGIYGPITSPKITNNTTGDTLDFAGTTIAAGDWYTIDCRYGYKTVEDQDGANAISDLSTDSDIATFSIEATPQAVNGVNSFTVTGDSVTSATNIKVAYYTRYLGV